MTRKNFESRLTALEAEKGAQSGKAETPPELLQCLDVLAAHAGQGPKESKAEAVGRALGMDCAAMRDLLKRDAFRFWALVLDKTGAVKQAGMTT